ncbi:predicted protein [Nematostella vectensis]|uniref:G-protein coupled receptors family 1 profile domain-containing protein n=1 Tax=Nematostella vectensis TaxID=45351 RepID=A7S6H1_NEMVE|nr:histamine H2 receptor [Nematostella vectensis]EDO40718.1 predicted protein [Nematostella vectensis]|eukprot:XP_001632781.1 predicted protein [Nematostella vectensis]
MYITITSIFVCVLSVVAIVTNSIVLLVVWTHQRMRTYTNGYVASLATSDVMMAMALILQYVHILNSPPVINVIYSVVFLSSLTNLCAITLDRYFALTSPLHYRHSISQSFPLSLLSIWVIPVFFATLPFCWDANIKLTIHKVYLGIVESCIIVIFVIIFAAYIRVTISVRKTRINKTSNSKKRKCDLRRASTIEKLARLFVFHASVFLFSWGPIIFTTGAGMVGRLDLIPNALYHASPLSITLGLIANPVVYGLMKPDFQEVLQRLRKKKGSTSGKRLHLLTSSIGTRGTTNGQTFV